MLSEECVHTSLSLGDRLLRESVIVSNRGLCQCSNVGFQDNMSYLVTMKAKISKEKMTKEKFPPPLIFRAIVLSSSICFN